MLGSATTTLNRNVGKYNLHHIQDRVLLNTPHIRINNDNGHVHKTPFSGHTQSIPTNSHAHRSMGHIGHAQTSGLCLSFCIYIRICTKAESAA